MNSTTLIILLLIIIYILSINRLILLDINSLIMCLIFVFTIALFFGNGHIESMTDLEAIQNIAGLLNSNNATITNLTVTGTINATGDIRSTGGQIRGVTVRGDTQISAGGDLDVAGNLKIDKNAMIVGNTELKGNVAVTGNTNITGNANVGGKSVVCYDDGIALKGLDIPREGGPRTTMYLGSCGAACEGNAWNSVWVADTARTGFKIIKDTFPGNNSVINYPPSPNPGLAVFRALTGG
jgi:hypothetical protein